MNLGITSLTVLAFILSALGLFILFASQVLPLNAFQALLFSSIYFSAINLCFLLFLGRIKGKSDKQYTNMLFLSMGAYPAAVLVLVILSLNAFTVDRVTYFIGLMALYLVYKVAFVLPVQKLR